MKWTTGFGLSPLLGKKGGTLWSSYWTTHFISALAAVATSGTEQTVTATVSGTGHDGVSFEFSTDDGANWTVKGTAVDGVLSATGLTANTMYLWRARLYKGTNYSSYFATTVYCTYLPQKLILNTSLYSEAMDSADGYTTVGTGTTLALNESEVKEGAGSLKLTTPSGAVGGLRRLVTWDLSDATRRNISVWVYIHSDRATTFTSFTINIFSAGTGNYVYKTITSYYYGAFITGMWIEIKLSPSSGWSSGSGSIDWAAVNKIGIDITPKSGQVCIASFDFFQAGIVYKPAAVLTFDDSDPTVYTKGFPEIASRNMKGTFYIISDDVDDVDKITTVQLKALYDAGWNIGNHTSGHTDLTTLTEANQLIALEACETWLVANDMPDFVKHVSYPLYKYNADTIAALTTFGGKTGRSGSLYFYTDFNTIYTSGYVHLTPPCYSFPFELMSKYLLYDDTLAQSLAKLVTALAVPGVALSLHFHYLVDADPLNNNYTTMEVFEGTLDWMITNNVQSLTIDEFYRLNSGGISVNHK